MKESARVLKVGGGDAWVKENLLEYAQYFNEVCHHLDHETRSAVELKVHV